MERNCGNPIVVRTEFRFYEELNDFLPMAQRKRPVDYQFSGTPAVKDAIEAIGVPHVEVDLIVIDGISVGFGYKIRGGERIAVYPVFERFDITPISRLRPRPLRHSSFILDVHLGKLARHLRLLGFDVLYDTQLDDHDIVRISKRDKRAILTRDRGLLKHSSVERGYWIRTTQPKAQTREVLTVFQLENCLQPFSRCLECNTPLRDLRRQKALGRVPATVSEQFTRFSECPGCARVYWQGGHYEHLRELVGEFAGRCASA